MATPIDDNAADGNLDKRNIWLISVGHTSNGEIIERAVHDFQKTQRHMMTAKKENATETYAELKDDYVSLKAVLNSLGVNLTELDKIKE